MKVAILIAYDVYLFRYLLSDMINVFRTDVQIDLLYGGAQILASNWAKSLVHINPHIHQTIDQSMTARHVW